MQKRLVGDVPLNVNFALSRLKVVVVKGAVFFTKFDKYSICITIVAIEYVITDNVH